jgi:hypothetical protein
MHKIVCVMKQTCLTNKKRVHPVRWLTKNDKVTYRKKLITGTRREEMEHLKSERLSCQAADIQNSKFHHCAKKSQFTT